jgi:hypothetical protein
MIGRGCEHQFLHSITERSSGKVIAMPAASVRGESVKGEPVASARSKSAVPDRRRSMSPAIRSGAQRPLLRQTAAIPLRRSVENRLGPNVQTGERNKSNTPRERRAIRRKKCKPIKEKRE